VETRHKSARGSKSLDMHEERLDGRRVGGFARFVHGNDSRFPAGGKGARRPRPVENGEKILLLISQL